MQILKNERNRLAFRFGRATALRSTNDVVDQLMMQLGIERRCVDELRCQLDAALKQLDTVRAELLDRNLLLRLVGSSCSPTMH